MRLPTRGCVRVCNISLTAQEVDELLSSRITADDEEAVQAELAQLEAAAVRLLLTRISLIPPARRTHACGTRGEAARGANADRDRRAGTRTRACPRRSAATSSFAGLNCTALYANCRRCAAARLSIASRDLVRELMLARLALQPPVADLSSRALRTRAIVSEIPARPSHVPASRSSAWSGSHRCLSWVPRRVRQPASNRGGFRRAPRWLRLTSDRFEPMAGLGERGASDMRMVFLGTAAGGHVSPMRGQSSLVVQLHALGGACASTFKRAELCRAVDVRLRRGDCVAIRVREISHEVL